MKLIRMIAIVVCLSFALVQMPAIAQAATTVDATINYVTSANGTSWINANITSGATTTANQNFVFPAAQSNTLMAVALSAVASGKTVKLQTQGGNWSNLYGIMIYP